MIALGNSSSFDFAIFWDGIGLSDASEWIIVAEQGVSIQSRTRALIFFPPLAWDVFVSIFRPHAGVQNESEISPLQQRHESGS